MRLCLSCALPLTLALTYWTQLVSSTAMQDGRAPRIKNRAPAAIQVTAEQLLCDAQERQESQFHAPEQRVEDFEELHEYHGRKWEEFEKRIRQTFSRLVKASLLACAPSSSVPSTWSFLHPHVPSCPRPCPWRVPRLHTNLAAAVNKTHSSQLYELPSDSSSLAHAPQTPVRPPPRVFAHNLHKILDHAPANSRTRARNSTFDGGWLYKLANMYFVLNGQGYTKLPSVYCSFAHVFAHISSRSPPLASTQDP